MICGKIVLVKHKASVIFLEILHDYREQLVFKNELMNSLIQLTPAVGDLISVEGVQEHYKSKWGTSLPSINVTCIHYLRKSSDNIFRKNIDISALRRRSNAENQVRNYLISLGYISVDVPILTNGETSSAACSFSTYSEGYGEDLFLRKSMDPFLRILSCAGVNRIFSIGKCFRNGFVTSKYRSEFELLSIFTNYQSQKSAIELTNEILQLIIDAKTVIFEYCEADKYETSRSAGKFCVIQNYHNTKNAYAARKNGSNDILDEFKIKYNDITVIHGVREIETIQEYRQKIDEQGKSMHYGELEVLENALLSAAPPCYNIALSIPRILNLLFECECEAFPHQRLKKYGHPERVYKQI